MWDLCYQNTSPKCTWTADLIKFCHTHTKIVIFPFTEQTVNSQESACQAWKGFHLFKARSHLRAGRNSRTLYASDLGQVWQSQTSSYKSQEEKGEDGDSLVTFSFTSASKIQQETKPETPHLNIYF